MNELTQKETSLETGQGFSAHSTAKSALDALVKSLAFELGPYGIRVNAVSPGLTITDAPHLPLTNAETLLPR